MACRAAYTTVGIYVHMKWMRKMVHCHFKSLHTLMYITHSYLQTMISAQKFVVSCYHLFSDSEILFSYIFSLKTVFDHFCQKLFVRIKVIRFYLQQKIYFRSNWVFNKNDWFLSEIICQMMTLPVKNLPFSSR